MEKIIREIAQFQLIVVKDKYFIRNNQTEQESLRFGREKVDTFLILEKNDFAQRCIQRTGNNLKIKVQ